MEARKITETYPHKHVSRQADGMKEVRKECMQKRTQVGLEREQGTHKHRLVHMEALRIKKDEEAE